MSYDKIFRVTYFVASDIYSAILIPGSHSNYNSRVASTSDCYHTEVAAATHEEAMSIGKERIRLYLPTSSASPTKPKQIKIPKHLRSLVVFKG